VAKIREDMDGGALNEPVAEDPDAVVALFAERAPDAVTWAGWQAIDAAEKSAGEPHGRPRVKLIRVADLVASSRATR
jgi:ferredoxin--NADP+ reductase